MTESATPRPSRFRTGGLSPRKPTRFSYRPDAAERAALAAELGLLALHALDLTGEIAPAGRDELVLTAQLKVRADQACIVTLAPVRAEIDEEVRRRYVAGLADPEGDEVEMPEDDSVEPMPEVIDLAEIAAEALALALPLYPRAPGADFGSAVHAAEDVKALTDADLKPFAGLADLAKQLSSKDKSGSGEGG
ncbi:YceD family protein [Tabrizicola sp.]|uniref:YceD family protein n=1 Tax=Tabrizicola sp. TaxID=2005166 RepID=UPI003F3C178C